MIFIILLLVSENGYSNGSANEKGISNEQKETIREIMIKEFISREESDTEVCDGVERHVIVVKPLPWRGQKANRLMKKLDSKSQKQKNKQSVIQTLPRIIGHPSSRRKPMSFSDDFWGFVAP